MGYPRHTRITIACGPKPGFNDIQVQAVSPSYVIRIKSSSACPAHEGGTVSFPYWWTWWEYVYQASPSRMISNTLMALDSPNLKKKVGDKVIDGKTKIVFNWGDHDKYHNLSCYNLHMTESTLPFTLPSESTYMGLSQTTVYNPVTKQFDSKLSDSWQYNSKEGPTTFWFESGKTIPLKSTVGNTTTVYYNGDINQPPKSTFAIPDPCYPYQRCGQHYNTCKDPFCCVLGTDPKCVLCGKHDKV